MDAMKDLQNGLEIYGADLERWPAELRAGVEPALASEAGRNALAQARAVDGLLDRLTVPDASHSDTAALTARVMAAIEDKAVAGGVQGAREIASRSVRQRTGWAAGLLAASLMIGLFAGAGGIGAETLNGAAALVAGEINQTEEVSSFAELTFDGAFELDVDAL